MNAWAGIAAPDAHVMTYIPWRYIRLLGFTDTEGSTTHELDGVTDEVQCLTGI